MSSTKHPKVLAIAIDAVEPKLVREMIDQGELPALGSLLARGNWIRLQAPADIGSGAVWPTFITGTDPAAHGVYGEWCWQAGSMSLNRYRGRDLTPFWKELAETDTPVGILDLPFMPMLGLREGFEISEWAPHDLLEGRMQLAPEKIRAVVSRSPHHALSTDRLENRSSADLGNLENLAAGCIEGIKLRGKLAQELLRETEPLFALICFTEIHRTGHYLWHTVEPEHRVYVNNGSAAHPAELNLKNLIRAVDLQIGKLAEACGDDATVLVFSLHGMRPAQGTPTFLAPLLCELGFAHLAGWQEQSWTERAITALAAVKRNAPSGLKKIYYKNLPATTTQRLARPTMLPAYNWAKTRAFSLPTDQHGWIRINLEGREAKGSVSVNDYDELCGELESSLRLLTTESGKPLVRQVLRTSVDAETALRSRLPDLVAHWEDAVFESPLRIKGSAVSTPPVGTYTGQHALEGFCISTGRDEWASQGSVAAKDLGRLITAHLMSDKL